MTPEGYALYEKCEDLKNECQKHCAKFDITIDDKSIHSRQLDASSLKKVRETAKIIEDKVLQF